MKFPYRLLVIDDDEHALTGMLELLRDDGHDVTGASTYDAAKQLLASSAFDLLVTDVRLRAFNGLHLVMQSRHDCPDMAVVIVTGYDEPALELEASRYNARFVRKPFRGVDFLGVIHEALAGVRRQRRWPRKRVLGGFRVTAAGRTAAVLDVSYGGLRLELPGGERLPTAFDVEVSGIGLHLSVEPVWSTPLQETGGTLCGAALLAGQTTEAVTWRAIVDRLTA